MVEHYCPTVGDWDAVLGVGVAEGVFASVAVTAVPVGDTHTLVPVPEAARVRPGVAVGGGCW